MYNSAYKSSCLHLSWQLAPSAFLWGRNATFVLTCSASRSTQHHKTVISEMIMMSMPQPHHDTDVDTWCTFGHSTSIRCDPSTQDGKKPGVSWWHDTLRIRVLSILEFNFCSINEWGGGGDRDSMVKNIVSAAWLGIESTKAVFLEFHVRVCNDQPV